MTKTAEQVLAEVAERLDEGRIGFTELRAMTAEYLPAPKPEPDRLTVAARECGEVIAHAFGVPNIAQIYIAGAEDESEEVAKIRAIIAREVAAAEPSDEAIERVMHMIRVGTWRSEHDIRAALKGEGA